MNLLPFFYDCKNIYKNECNFKCKNIGKKDCKNNCKFECKKNDDFGDNPLSIGKTTFV